MIWINVLQFAVVGVEVATIVACRVDAVRQAHGPAARVRRSPMSFDSLRRMSQRLASVRRLAVADVERALGCRLDLDPEDSRQFWCTWSSRLVENRPGWSGASDLNDHFHR